MALARFSFSNMQVIMYGAPEVTWRKKKTEEKKEIHVLGANTKLKIMKMCSCLGKETLPAATGAQIVGRRWHIYHKTHSHL